MPSPYFKSRLHVLLLIGMAKRLELSEQIEAPQNSQSAPVSKV
jgi:hypothetical protein